MKQYITIISLIIFLILSLISCKNDTDKKEITNNLAEQKEEPKVVIDINTDSFELDKKDIATYKVTKEEKPATKEEISKMIADKNSKKKNKHQTFVQDFFEACSNKDYAKAAKFMAYKGMDKTRLNKDSFNPSNPLELNTVKATVDVIYGFLQESRNYEFIAFNEKVSKKGKIYEIEVSFFKKGIGINRRFFDIMESEKGLIIFEMR